MGLLARQGRVCVLVVHGDDDPGGHERIAVALRGGRWVNRGIDGGEHAALDRGLGAYCAMPVLVVHAGAVPVQVAQADGGQRDVAIAAARGEDVGRWWAGGRTCRRCRGCRWS